MGFFEDEENEDAIDVSTLDTTSELAQKVKTVIEYEVAPALAADGGSIEFIGMKGTEVVVNLLGACAHCPSATITLQYGVQSMLIESVPEVTGVIRA